MIVVRFMGGLGNQMFQYAAALRLALKHKTRPKLDLSFLLDRTDRGFTFRDFDLVIFNVPDPVATAEEVRMFRRLKERGSRTLSEKIADKLTNRRFYLEAKAGFHPEVLELPDDTYLEGFFQDERYFSDIQAEVRQGFRLQPEEAQLPPETRRLADEIRGDKNSICLHVRRGDYVTNPGSLAVVGFCTYDYYHKALLEMRARNPQAPVFIFSDDVKWCRENFAKTEQITVVGEEHAGPRSSHHFWLMTLCKHFVIPNSTFSWWAAWLSENPQKIVVRPSRWFRAAELKDADICPASWIKVSNE